jgi:hypothetical protein
MKKKLKKIFKMIWLILLATILILFIYTILQKPSLDRNWNLDQKILSEIDFSGNIINIQNIRNINYNSIDEYDVNYYDKKYNLDEIESVYYIIETFSHYNWPAHTMLSFGFKNWDYLVISAEIRKEVGESFSPFLWILNQYEMVYVLWDENDLIKLRTNYRKDDVFLYPIKISNDNIKKLFISALKRADKLVKEPEFYNTFTNTCITSILKHVNELRTNSWKEWVNWSKQIFLPANSDKTAFDLWFIDTKLPLEEAREYYQINELAEKFWNDKNFSKLIRKEIK